MVESLAQPIAVIAMFAAERGSQRVAFRLEHQGLAFIVIQRLEKSRGTAVCRNEKHPDRRLLRFVAAPLPFVFFIERLFAVGMHHIYQMTAQRQPPLTRRGLCTDKEEQVRTNLPLPINARHLRQARGKDSERPQQEHIAVFGRDAVRADIIQQTGQRSIYLIRKDREFGIGRRQFSVARCHRIRFLQFGILAIWQ